MESLHIIGGIVFIILAGYNYFLYIFYKKINKLEIQILHLFQKRVNMIPALYDISKNFLSKHEDVFEEILNLKRQQIYNENTFDEEISIQSHIHHELNFIFTVINKHSQIQKNGKYLLLKDLFVENSSEIGKKMILYKKIIKKYNFFQAAKDFTILGIFLNIPEKKEI